MIKSILSQWNLSNKRVFLRADLNVPIKDGKVSNDFRIINLLPTIDFILKQKGSIVLATHLGKPKNHDPQLSTQILIPWFEQHNYKILFVSDILSVAHLPIIPEQIILLENLRFFPGETTPDPLFAKELASTATYYVNDAFGTLHRYDCSISLLPYEFSEHRRSIGFLVEKELQALETLTQNPDKPFVAIIGGGKIADKIPLIEHLLTTIDTLILCPALCFSFLAALGQETGQSLVDPQLYQLCKNILQQAEYHHVSVIFPTDYQIAETTKDGKISIIDAQNFPHNAFGIAIGPKSIHLVSEYIKHAKTIFFNGAMGFAERPETRQSTYDIFNAMANTKGTTYIAGGDTVEALFNAKLSQSIDYLSTGGGAALSYISGNLLPGLAPFEEQ